jgi:hypothetical protein
MRGTYTLTKPIVGIPVGATRTTTLPSGASVEVRHNAQAALVHTSAVATLFMVHLPDLLDACGVEDVGEIAWCRGGETPRVRRNDTGREENHDKAGTAIRVISIGLDETGSKDLLAFCERELAYRRATGPSSSTS